MFARLTGRAVGLCLLLAMVWAPGAAAAERGCTASQTPAFARGFQALRARVGEVMGDPTSCEYADPSGTGDVLQDTTTGLAFWRKSTNTPTFTDGAQHWALTDAGLVEWTGAGIDPPGTLLPPSPPSPPSPPPPPTPPPAPQPSAGNHDWHDPGYVSAINGVLFDTRCVPLQSVGSNVLNLPFRAGADADLEWMRSHNVRWLRVLATGHALPPNIAPRDARDATTALEQLLRRVDSFNAAHDPSQSIYVLIGLTDYYPPGVPGDGHAYDHPTFKDTPVLPAPWYRAGTPYFDFDQEHGFGQLSHLPNYEQFYKPWVESIVQALSQYRSLLGWQLGNELKARGSSRNGISNEQAYAWYLAFTRDMVDTIRSHDRHHLIVTAAQYVAELTDYEYRPNARLDLSLVHGYRQLFQRFVDDCGQSCWNIMGLTAYDFNPYPLDDATLAQQAHVAAMMTEYGFTNQPNDTPADRMARFGASRSSAVALGWMHPWMAIDGSPRAGFASAADLVRSGLVTGLAPWASPAPQSAPGSGLDLDSQRGVTGAPDSTELWAAWSTTGARLEAANKAAGPSAACLNWSPSVHATLHRLDSVWIR